MTMTKSRRATAREDRIDVIAKSASVPDLNEFLDEHEVHVRAMVTKLWSIYGGEKGDKVVQYTQKHHSALLSILGHHDGLIMLLTRSLADSLHRLKTIEGELKTAKSLQTRSLDRRFSLEDLEVEQIDDRNIKIALVRGDDEAAFNLKFPVVVDRGLWNERAIYERGDGVSHGGSWWIASKDSPGKPGDGSWRLAVKRGRDGKDTRA